LSKEVKEMEAQKENKDDPAKNEKVKYHGETSEKE